MEVDNTITKGTRIICPMNVAPLSVPPQNYQRSLIINGGSIVKITTVAFEGAGIRVEGKLTELTLEGVSFRRMEGSVSVWVMDTGVPLM